MFIAVLNGLFAAITLRFAARRASGFGLAAAALKEDNRYVGRRKTEDSYRER